MIFASTTPIVSRYKDALCRAEVYGRLKVSGEHEPSQPAAPPGPSGRAAASTALLGPSGNGLADQGWYTKLSSIPGRPEHGWRTACRLHRPDKYGQRLDRGRSLRVKSVPRIDQAPRAGSCARAAVFGRGSSPSPGKGGVLGGRAR